VTRVLVLLIVLYVIWRVATILGRRRRQEYESHLRRDDHAVELVRCSVCGRYVNPADVRWEGLWPFQRPVCLEDLEGRNGEDHPPDT
jgi:predicted transcriptional regulator